MKTYVLFYRENYKRMLLPSKEVIALSTVEEKGAQNNKDVCGIQNNVRGLEKSLR